VTTEVQSVINRGSNDSLLQLVASLTDKGIELPLTLFVNGTIISGILIGRKKYLDQFVSQFTTGWDDESVNILRDAFGLNENPEESEDAGEIDNIRFVHLRDAKVYSPGQEPLPANGLLWRGKIAEVNGFSYGMFSKAQ